MWGCLLKPLHTIGKNTECDFSTLCVTQLLRSSRCTQYTPRFIAAIGADWEMVDGTWRAEATTAAMGNKARKTQRNPAALATGVRHKFSSYSSGNGVVP